MKFTEKMRNVFERIEFFYINEKGEVATAFHDVPKTEQDSDDFNEGYEILMTTLHENERARLSRVYNREVSIDDIDLTINRINEDFFCHKTDFVKRTKKENTWLNRKDEDMLYEDFLELTADDFRVRQHERTEPTDFLGKVSIDKRIVLKEVINNEYQCEFIIGSKAERYETFELVAESYYSDGTKCFDVLLDGKKFQDGSSDSTDTIEVVFDEEIAIIRDCGYTIKCLE